MNIILVDNEKEDLKNLENAVTSVVKGADIRSFAKEKEALRFARDNSIDIAFLAIQMKRVDGITMAKRLMDINPRINIIFCTNSLDYTMEALDVYCSAYLIKPMSEYKIQEAMKHLRYMDAEGSVVALSAGTYASNKSALIRVSRGAVFEAYDMKGQILTFKRSRTKTLLKLLVDKGGNPISTIELLDALWPDRDEQNIDKDRDYLYKLFGDLKRVLKTCDAVDLLKKVYNGHCIDVSKIEIDD